MSQSWGRQDRREFILRIIMRGQKVAVRVVSRSAANLQRAFADPAFEKVSTDVLDVDAAIRAVDGCSLVYEDWRVFIPFCPGCSRSRPVRPHSHGYAQLARTASPRVTPVEIGHMRRGRGKRHLIDMPRYTVACRFCCLPQLGTCVQRGFEQSSLTVSASILEACHSHPKVRSIVTFLSTIGSVRCLEVASGFLQ